MEKNKVEERYCPFCKEMVTKGMKYYRYHRNPRDDSPPREVCPNGCNTNWEELYRWNKSQSIAFEKGVKFSDILFIQNWTKRQIIAYKLGVEVKNIKVEENINLIN